MDEEQVPTASRYLTVSEVAALLRVSNMTVYRLVSSGALPAVRVGRSVRLRAEAVDDYLRGRDHCQLTEGPADRGNGARRTRHRVLPVRLRLPRRVRGGGSGRPAPAGPVGGGDRPDP